MNGGEMEAGGGGKRGGGSRERKRKGREKERREREEEEEAARQFKLALVTLDWLARLSRAAYSGTTGEHMVQASWAASRTIVDDATQSRHKTWRD
jgi:hypothetical protein